ncbi:hypothetical protein ASD11_00670 [Aeromicrobium sp. Root495]|uniref:class I adenylate-forming enzyme family protein n=1 Tax=Aeromicrobium sp. Root495 TaxID=1736550 RepID=UPI0006FE85C6|nr:AMP-binding protein [Aeromicrobium sp. Root495]KQY58218.1 hypothetical protein ASD11_00670 [Aeromicrobium sp. Root495]
MPTLGGLVAQQAARVPQREALVAGERRWTWRRLDAEVSRAAGTLAAAGVRPGDRVAIVASNTPENVVAYFATLRLAAIVVPVNTRLAPPELRHVVEDSGSRVVLVGAPEEATVGSALADVPGVEVRALTSLADDSVAPVVEDRATEASDALIVYTSGTTGRPKGVLHSHHSAIWAALAQVTSLGMTDGERYLHLPPLYHSGGVVYLDAMALLGGTNVLVPVFEPAAVLEVIETEHITALLGVPTMFQLLLREPSARTRDTSSWRIGVFGAAPMPEKAIGQLLETFPTVSFTQQCGQTEAGPTGLFSTMDQVRSCPDSSGHQAQPFVEAMVVRPDGEPVGPDEVGELCFRSEAVMKGYWNDPDATAEAVRDGWLHTGDLLHVRPDGSMKLVDRMKDVIITGGRNVYSAEVEQAVVRHPAVADCAVVGEADEVWGETVVVVVTLEPGRALTIEELRAHCLGLVADYKVPRVLRYGPVPRNPAGKVQKHLLRSSPPDA